MTLIGKEIGEEEYGSDAASHQLYLFDEHQNTIKPKFDSSGSTIWWSSLVQLCKVVFLPQGYPESVSADYLHYQLWDTLQAFLSTLMGALSAHSILKGLGVGDETATPVTAAITWLLKDGTGMIGRIIFAWLKGSALDCNSKQWRLFADVMNDVAIFFDLIAVYAGSFNMCIFCLSSFCRSIVGVAGGATRAAFVQHQARRGNFADVAAKDGSQETLVNLSGLVVGLVLISTISQNTTLTWICYISLVCLHLMANYKAVKSIVMETLNQSRLCILVEHFLENSSRINGLEETNMEENIILGMGSGKIHLGCSLRKTASKLQEFQRLKKLYYGGLYLLNVDMKTNQVFITLHRDSDNMTLLESSFQAQVILYYFRKESSQMVRNFEKSSGSLLQEAKHSEMNKWKLLEWSRELTLKEFSTFVKTAEIVGWDVNRPLLGADEWKATW